ncbi:MAG: hypothetical protein WEC59_02325 [Salibacteraceae bacterium]
MKKFLIAFVMIGTLSCQKDEYFGPVTENDDQGMQDSSEAVILIGCEGNFQYANASLSGYYPRLHEVVNNLYQTANNQSLGDVLQSMFQMGDSVFLVLNNSGIIRIVEKGSYKEIATIEGLNSPRYVTTSNSHLIVSDFMGGMLSVVNLQSLNIDQTISAPDWTEQLCKHKESVYFVGKSDSTLNLLSNDLQSIETSIFLNADVIHIGVINDEVVYVANRNNGSGVYKWKNGQVTLLNQWSSKITSATFSDDFIYMVQGKTVKKLDKYASELLVQEHNAETPYGLYADDNCVMISDARDYLSKGRVRVFDLNLDFKNDLKVGFIPQSFLRIE